MTADWIQLSWWKMRKVSDAETAEFISYELQLQPEGRDMVREHQPVPMTIL